MPAKTTSVARSAAAREQLLAHTKELVCGGAPDKEVFEVCDVPCELVASWRRCSAAGIDPADPIDARRVERRSDSRDKATGGVFLGAALEKAATALEPVGALVCLSRVTGEVEAVFPQARFSVLLGTCATFDERAVGTCAPVLTAATGDVWQVDGSEHYLDALSGVVSVAVPIVSDDKVEGVLSIFVPRDVDAMRGGAGARSLLLACARAAASSISATFQIQALSRTSQFYEALSAGLLASRDGGIFVIDHMGRIIQANRAGGELLGLDASAAQCFGAFVGDAWWSYLGKAVREGRTINNIEVAVETAEGSRICAISTRPVPSLRRFDAQPACVVSVRLVEELSDKALLPHLSTRIVRFEDMIGESPAYRRMIEDMQTLAATKATVLL